MLVTKTSLTSDTSLSGTGGSSSTMKSWSYTQMKKVEGARMKVKRMVALTRTAPTTTATQMIMRAILATAITTWKPHNRKQRDVIK